MKYVTVFVSVCKVQSTFIVPLECFTVLQFASTVNSRNSVDLDKGKRAHLTVVVLLFCYEITYITLLLSSEEDDDDEEEESEEDSGEIMLQSSSLSKVDDEDVMEPPDKQPRINLNLHTDREPQHASVTDHQCHQHNSEHTPSL